MNHDTMTVFLLKGLESFMNTLQNKFIIFILISEDVIVIVQYYDGTTIRDIIGNLLLNRTFI